jgi:lipopolysaccharide export LptBFGC system permease protein LptF
MLVVMAFHHLGSASYGISPTLAVWVPLMVFVPLAVEMAWSMNK